MGSDATSRGPGRPGGELEAMVGDHERKGEDWPRSREGKQYG